MAEFKQALITGGAGFIGSHLVKYLHAHTELKLRLLELPEASAANWPDRVYSSP